MKIALIVMTVITGLLMFSTVVCGLWLRYSGKAVETSSLDFHMWVAIGMVVAMIITIVLAFLNLPRVTVG